VSEMGTKKIRNAHLEFTSCPHTAEQKYSRYKDYDPYPEIVPSLLNTADIVDYVRAVGMICPFEPSRLGPSSYEMVLGGEYMYWDSEKKSCTGVLKADGKVVLKQNSITFVSTKEAFRLPHYIGVRFNFRVKHVHRGLLLGTGPLVDPGYHGNLMIPIHNLTSNDYEIDVGEKIISIEFTKISPNSFFKNKPKALEGRTAPLREGVFQENSYKNSGKSFGDMMKDILPLGIGMVVSSLTDTLAEANRRIEENKVFLAKVKKYSIIGAVTVLIALASLYIDLNSLLTDANKYVADASMLMKRNSKADYDIRNLVEKDALLLVEQKISSLPSLLERISKIEEGLEQNEKQDEFAREIESLKTEVQGLKEAVEGVESHQPEQNNAKD